MASSNPKSRTVYAGPGDEIPAIILKLQRRRGSPVVLVANNCPALHLRENLEFLQRQAEELDLDLTVVCGDRRVRDLASALGLVVVKSLGALRAPEQSDRNQGSAFTDAANSQVGQTRNEAPGAAEKTIHTRSPAKSMDLKANQRRNRRSLSLDRSFSSILAVATLIIVLLFVVWGVLYIVLPNAKIELTPVQQRYSTVLQLRADPQVSRLNAATGEVPAQLIVIEETDEMTVPATGVRSEPTARAEGNVVFSNRISQRVVVPKGTVVLTNDNRRFTTAAEVTIPPTSGTSGLFGAKRVGIVASEPGPISNADSGAITYIEDQALNQRLIVNNDAPIQGGGERAVSFITEQDRLQLYNQLRDVLKQRVWQQLRNRSDLKESTFVTWDADVIVDEAVYDSSVGDESNEVTLRMRVKLRGTAFSNAYLEEVVPVILERIVENQLEDYELVTDTVDAGEPQVKGITDGVIQLSLEAQGDLVSTWDLGEIRRDLANVTREDAEDYLDNLMGVGDFSLEMGPDWYDRMPRLWFRIDIDVLSPLQLAA